MTKADNQWTEPVRDFKHRTQTHKRTGAFGGPSAPRRRMQDCKNKEHIRVLWELSVYGELLLVVRSSVC